MSNLELSNAVAIGIERNSDGIELEELENILKNNEEKIEQGIKIMSEELERIWDNKIADLFRWN